MYFHVAEKKVSLEEDNIITIKESENMEEVALPLLGGDSEEENWSDLSWTPKELGKVCCGVLH